MAIKESSTPEDVVILEGKVADATVVGTDVLVVSRDFDLWRWRCTGG